MYGIKAPVAQGSGQPTYNRSIQVRFLAGAPFITYTHNLRTAQKGLEKTDEDEQEEGREMSESITEELREYAAEHSYWRRGTEYVTLNDLLPIADRIDARFDRELQAKHDEIDGLKADVDGLQARLDASMPLPLDADGVPWTGREDEFIADTDERCRLLGVLHSVEGGDFLEVDDGSGRYFIADACRHVAPEPPEPPDSQERIDADAKKTACEYFGRSGKSCIGCPADGGTTTTSCMKRQMSDLLRRQRELDGAGEQA